MIYFINGDSNLDIVEWAKKRKIALNKEGYSLHHHPSGHTIQNIKMNDIVIGILTKEVFKQVRKVGCSFLHLSVESSEKTVTVRCGAIYSRDYDTLPDFII